MMFSHSIKRRAISSIIAGFCVVCMATMAALYQVLPVPDAVMSCWCRLNPYGEDWTREFSLNRFIKKCPVVVGIHGGRLNLRTSAWENDGDHHYFRIAAGVFCRPSQIMASLLGIFLLSSLAWFFLAGFTKAKPKGSK